MDYSKVYDEYNKAKEYQLQAEAQRYKSQIDALNAQKPTIEQNYADASNKAYLNSRLSSRGQAENLAAMGLGRGYNDAPSSGYGERQIARSDTALRGSLNDLELQKQSDLTNIQNQIVQAQNTSAANAYGINADYAQKIAAIKQAEQEAIVQEQYRQQQIAAANAKAAAESVATNNVTYGNATTLQSAYDSAVKQYNSGKQQQGWEILYEAYAAANGGTPDKAELARAVASMGPYSQDEFNKWYSYKILPESFQGWASGK